MSRRSRSKAPTSSCRRLQLDSAAYAAAVNETQSLGAEDSTTRSAAETQAALFWNLQTGTDNPPGEWNSIADQIAPTEGDSIATDAQLLAELNVAEGDAGIAAFSKYTYNAWRPITAIQNADEIGNSGITQDSTWTPLITTPALPGIRRRACGVQRRRGADSRRLFRLELRLHDDLAEPPRRTLSVTSFDEAAQNAGESRVWGGIHFPFSVDAGFTLGQEVGDWTLSVFNQTQDTVPPKIVLDQTSGLMTNTDPTITGDVTDNLSGVASLAVALDGGAAQNVSFDANGNFSVPVALPTDGTADGQHTLTFTAVDAAGNVTSPLVFDFTLDTQAPQISLAADNIQNGGTLAAGAMFDGTVTTEAGVALTALSYAFDGGAAVPLGFDATSGAFDQALNLSQLAAGNHTLTLTAKDAAGNKATDTLNVALPALPLLTIAQLTPMMGASDVGVIYRPQITFSRAVDATTLTSSSFYATDTTGSVVPGDHRADDRQCRQCRRRLVAVHQSIARCFDDHAPCRGRPDQGCRRLLARRRRYRHGGQRSDRDLHHGQYGTGAEHDNYRHRRRSRPRRHADDPRRLHRGRRRLLGFCQRHLEIADRRGSRSMSSATSRTPSTPTPKAKFTLTNVPVGDVKVVFDGTTATNDPAGIYFPTMTMDLTNVRPGIANTVMGSMGTLAEQQADAADPAIYLPRIADNILTPLSMTAPTVVTAPANTDFGSGQVSLTAPQLSELSLTVMPGSLVDANGNPVPNAEVGISPVPPAIVQDMLPAGLLQHSFDVTIQAPGGAVFTQPATLTSPIPWAWHQEKRPTSCSPSIILLAASSSTAPPPSRPTAKPSPPTPAPASPNPVGTDSPHRGHRRAPPSVAPIVLQ